MILNRDMHRLLRSLQVKYRRVRKASEFNVTIAEVHILVELDAAGELSVNQLTEALLITQSQISRILQKLRSKRLVTQRSDRADSRRVISLLTREGKTMINRIDQVMGGIFNVTVQSLNSREQRDMAQFFETVARGYGCTVIRVRSGESRLRACHRQMARVLGLLSNNVYGSTMTRAQWSILEAIIRAPEAISANILEGYLGVRSALISEILTSFEAHGFIEKTRSLENHRVNLLHPTALGRRQFRRLETQAVLRLKRCLQGYSPKELLRLYGILKKFAGEWGQDSIFLAQSLVTRPITETEIRAVRAFALRSIVARGWEYDAPETLLPSDRQIWGLFDQDSKLPEIKALCVAKPERLGWTVEFAIWHDSLSRSQFNAFVQYSHYLSYRGKAPAPLLINFEPLNR